MTNLAEQLKKVHRSKRRAVAKQIAKEGNREDVSTLKKMAQGGFYWTGTPFWSSPKYYCIRDQIAAFNALASFEGEGKSEALTALKSLVSEVEVSKPCVRPSQEDGTYNISYRVSFPQIRGRLGSRVYIDYFVIGEILSSREISDNILGASGKCIRDTVSSPDFAYTVRSRSNIVPSNACNRIYTRIRNLEAVCEESA